MSRADKGYDMKKISLFIKVFLKKKNLHLLYFFKLCLCSLSSLQTELYPLSLRLDDFRATIRFW